MSKDQLADLTQPQRDRLAFVELRVRFVGEIRRQDLVSRFGIQSAAATRDLKRGRRDRQIHANREGERGHIAELERERRALSMSSHGARAGA